LGSSPNQTLHEQGELPTFTSTAFFSLSLFD
jgi:hypothetical protein